MKTVDVALHRLAARQYSLAHRTQALELGMTPRQLHARISAGLLAPVHRGVYRVAGAPTSPQQALLAACLASGAVASHRSAAVLWGLRAVAAPSPEVIVARTACPTLHGVVVHRTDRLDRVDVSRVRRIPVTTPARPLVDLGFDLLNGTLGRLGAPGRNGAGVLREVVDERDPATAPTQSVLEDTLVRVLRKGGLPEPMRQYEVGGVRLDFAYPHVRPGIEADSRTWHGGRLDVQRNSDKGNVLLAGGWRVLHFTWSDIGRRPEHVITSVARELAVACPA